ncbi:ribose-phosphate diphosphokinase [Geoglobus acetivorans]|uniref:Ribose-phosphate pyrophosphokinase n=1 Tax=Geoglobus acetivorans TaxID=565033 RepID=A0A0A7GGI7_GEOAI|nr:phosphorybosyl pyrophosphate synthase [Geoglobus acetivorans]
MKLIAGPSSPLLAKRLSEAAKIDIADTTYRKFPDGELYVRVNDASDDRYVVVNSINSNEDLVYLLLIFEALSEKEIIAVIPYMGYARQDRAFLEGEAVSIRAIARLIEGYAERVITVNIHSSEAKNHFRKLVEVDAMPLIGEHYRERDVIMLSPDKGSLSRVRVAAQVAGCDFDYLEKTRIDAENVVIQPKNLDVGGRKVVIVDDIISTGGTMVTAAKQLAGNAEGIEAACVHAVLASNALNKLYSAGISEVISTDTVERQISKLSAAELISEVILD